MRRYSGLGGRASVTLLCDLGVGVGVDADLAYLCDSIVSLGQILQDKVTQMTRQRLHNEGYNRLAAHNEAQVVWVEVIRRRNKDLGENRAHNDVRAQERAAEDDEPENSRKERELGKMEPELGDLFPFWCDMSPWTEVSPERSGFVSVVVHGLVF